jgi:hypothetical protein
VEKFAVPAALPWRELAVEVRPEGVKVFWANEDGVLQFKEEVPAAGLEGLEGRLQAMKRPNPEMTGVPADYRPRSGIGLYVLGGEGSFRHVVVRPLAEGG